MSDRQSSPDVVPALPEGPLTYRRVAWSKLISEVLGPLKAKPNSFRNCLSWIIVIWTLQVFKIWIILLEVRMSRRFSY